MFVPGYIAEKNTVHVINKELFLSVGYHVIDCLKDR